MFAKKLLKASSPPAEAPRPMSNRGVRLPPWTVAGAVTPGAVDAALVRLGESPLLPRFPLCFCRAIECCRLTSVKNDPPESWRQPPTNLDFETVEGVLSVIYITVSVGSCFYPYVLGR